MKSIKKITARYMYGYNNLEIVIDHGEQYLTGFFTKDNMYSSLTKAPMQSKNHFIISNI